MSQSEHTNHPYPTTIKEEVYIRVREALKKGSDYWPEGFWPIDVLPEKYAFSLNFARI